MSSPPLAFQLCRVASNKKEGGEWEAARNEGGGGSWRKRDGIDGRSGRCKSRAPNFNPPLRRKSWCDRVGMGQWGNLAATFVAGGNSIREFFFNLSPLRERGASSIDSLRSGASRTFHQDLRRVEREEGGRGNDGIFRGRPVSIVAVGRGRLSWLATYEFYISCYNIILPGFWFL